MTISCLRIGRPLLVGAAGVLLLLGAYRPIHAADQPSVLIMGEDADLDTVPRHSRIFNRVSDALRTRMMEMGFNVYNETAATMDITNPGRVRRTDAELITVAQNVTAAPIDVIAAFQIYASANQNAYSDIKQIRIRIVGRMLQVQTGRDLGNFEVSVGPRGLKPLPPACNPDCILEHVGDEAKPIANEVGTILARKLDELSLAESKAPATSPQPVPPPAASTNASCTGLPTAYLIVLSGFDSADISDSLWAALASAYSLEQVFELIALVGFYHTVSFFANSFRLGPESHAEMPPVG